MANKDEASVQFGGFSTLLTVLFIGLKLTHYIDWSWWWVLSPLWLGLVVFFVLFIVVFFGVVVLKLVAELLR